MKVGKKIDWERLEQLKRTIQNPEYQTKAVFHIAIGLTEVFFHNMKEE